MRHATSHRRHSTESDANAIQAWRARINSAACGVAGQHEVAQGTGAPCVLLLLLRTGGVRIETTFQCLRFLFRKRLADDFLRRLEVTVHMRRRQRQLRANAVEPVPARIFAERTGRVGVEAHAEQVVDRVGVFLTTEPEKRDGRAHRKPRGTARGQPGGDPVRHLADGLGRRLLLVLRRHLARVDAQHDLVPRLGDEEVVEVG